MDHRSKMIMAAVLGAGVFIGTAGVFIYNHFLDKQRQRMAHQAILLENLDKSVAEIREEILKIKKQTPRRRTNTDHSADQFASTDDEEEEFYDLSDDEEEGEPFETEPLLKVLYQQVDEKMNGSIEDKEWCRERMLEHLEVFADNGLLLWRLAKCNNILAKTETDPVVRNRLLEQGLHYAARAVDSEPNSAEANKWYAIMIGQHADKQSTKERILNGFIFKKHIDIALDLAPNDGTLHHLAGRFNYELANLTWFEKKIASALYADLPAASFGAALAYFKKAHLLNNGPWRENNVMLAKTCAAMEDFNQALYWLNLSLSTPAVTPDDEALAAEAQNLVTKYSGRES